MYCPKTRVSTYLYTQWVLCHINLIFLARIMKTTGSAALSIILGSIHSEEEREVSEDAGFPQVNVFKR